MTTPLFSIHETPGGRGLRTTGLKVAGLSDFLVRETRPEFEDATREMLEILARYEIENQTRIKAGERVRHGYWSLEMRKTDDGTLEVFESTADGSSFVPGVDLTLQYWLDQHLICRGAGADFTPPLPDQKVALSAGVMEGVRPLDGVRYVEPGTMSGWFLTTGRYSGNVKDLQVEHLYHVTAARPELARYLALPPGFRFRLEKGKDDVYFDATVLQD